MVSVQTIIADPDIAEFLRTHQGAREEIEAAADELSSKDDAIRALRKLMNPLGKKIVPVFFSYKTKDEAVARAIVKALRRYSAGKLNITYQADFTAMIAGQKWRDWIFKSIRESNLFILLLPDPSDEWDWCLFETGLFEAQRTSADRLICLHHPDTEVPDQIKDYHAVSATIPEVESFLRSIFIKKGPIPGMKPLNKDVEEDIPEFARQIVDAIRPPRKAHYSQILEPWLKLKVANAKELKSKDDLDHATVEAANDEALRIFNMIDRPKTWANVRSALPDDMHNDRWREELACAIKHIASGVRPRPIQSVFQARSGRMYRPITYAVDRLGDSQGLIDTFQITFTEDVGAVDISEMPRSLSALATLLRFTFRFRWEVLEKFAKATMTEADIEFVKSTFWRMEVEWKSRGGGDLVDILNLFPNQKARTRLIQMFEDWAAIRNPDGTGELDVAIEMKDVQKVQEILRRIIPINQEFLEISTELFSKLIRELPQPRWHEERPWQMERVA